LQPLRWLAVPGTVRRAASEARTGHHDRSVPGSRYRAAGDCRAGSRSRPAPRRPPRAGRTRQLGAGLRSPAAASLQGRLYGQLRWPYPLHCARL